MRLVLAVVLLAVGARLVQIQVLQAGRYRTQASEELSQSVTVPAVRGPIYDRNGAVLALSVPTETVIADDFQVAHPDAEAAALAPLVGMERSRLAGLLAERSGYVKIAQSLAQSRAQRVANASFPGITLVDDSEREFPNGQLAAPVIGSVHASQTGASGLEYEYNSRLDGTPGHEVLEASPSGVSLPGTQVVDKTAARPGEGIETTLDEPLQFTTEQALAAQIVATHAVSGIAEVMDVRTGQILAMANLVANPAAKGKTTTAASSSVTVGPTEPVSEAPGNLALSQVYEPGSVFKLVTFSAALQDGVIGPDSTFTVPDSIELDGSRFHDAETHPTETLTATQILAQSSNIGTSEIAQALGETRLLAQVHTLGFGEATDLGFPGQAAGIVAGASQWEPTNFVSLPIGQVDAVTAQQVIDAYNMVANGGVFVTPKLTMATVGADGAPKTTPPSATHRVISPTVDTELNSMLEQVVAVGTGTSAVVPGYTVAGKTGTAQVPNAQGNGYVTGAYMASFVGYAPATHPVLSAIVVLNRPTPIFGGTVSAPVFSQIMSYALHRYDIPTTPGAPTEAPPLSTGAAPQTQDIT